MLFQLVSRYIWQLLLPLSAVKECIVLGCKNDSIMPRASQASILIAAREMNTLEEREEVKKEKASVANGKIFKKDVSHFD